MKNLKHLSYSSVSLWHACPRAHYLKYGLGIRDEPSAAQIFGTSVHNCVQNALVNGIRMTEAAKNFEGYFMHELNKRQASLTERNILYHLDLGKELLQDEFSAEIFADIHVSHTNQIEKSIEFWVPGVPIPVLGFIDVIDDMGNLYDIKTSRSDWDQKRADEGTQVDFYLTAMDSLSDHRHGGKFTYIIATKIRPCVYLIDTHREGYKEKVYSMVQEMWAGVSSGIVPERDDYLGERCNKCWQVATCRLHKND